MVVSLAARLAGAAGKAGLAGLGGLRAARPLAEKAGSAALNLLKGAGNQGSRFFRGAKQSSGRPLTGSSAEIGRKAAAAFGGLGKVGKAAADDIANITRSVLQSAGKTNAAGQAVAVQKAILTKYPGAGEVAAKVAARVRAGKTTVAGLDITGALKSSPAFLQTLGANTKSGIQTLINSPAGQKIANSRIGQGAKNFFDRANKATNPLTKNQAADDAFGAFSAPLIGLGNTAAQGARNIYSGIGSYLRSTPTGRQSLQNLSFKSGAPGSLNSTRSVLGKPNAYAGPTNTTVGSTQIPYGSSYAANSGLTKTTAQTMDDLGIPAAGGIGSLLGRIPGAGLFTGKRAVEGVPSTGLGSLLKGAGSFAYNNPIKTTVGGTLGLMYGPDAYDAATTAMFGKSPEQQFRQGVGSLMGTEENRRRTLGDLGALYAQGELGEAIGTPGARNLSQQQMRQYLGGSIFGDEGYANIPMRGGSGIFGGEGSPTMAGDIFNNPARESIMRAFGTQMNDEEIMEKYAEILDKQRRKKSLDAEDLQFLMMFEALSKPTNLPSDQFRRNQGFETQRAYNDVQNQLGGQFEVIDYNQLYPTYAQPQTAINMADGGEVARRVPDVSFSRYAQGGVANLMDGGAANGPGTGTSDSIPARLSDGEFVMTSDAVRGMGDGSRKDGVRKMYDLMNSLEAK
jgi:hypothetical protein